jgi:hypothetical protein
MSDSTQPSTWKSIELPTILSWKGLRQRIRISRPVMAHGIIACRIQPFCIMTLVGVWAASPLHAVCRQDQIIIPNRVGVETQDSERIRPTDSTTVEKESIKTSVVSVLRNDGRWVMGSLQNIGPERWSMLIRDAGMPSLQDFPTSEIVAFVVRREGLRPAVGSTAEIRQQSEVSLLRTTPLSLGVIQTIDGQRIPGTFRVVNGIAMWDHRWIGAIPIDLEQISTLRMLADRSAPQFPDSDAVLLINGDVLRGFVDKLDEDVTISSLQSQALREGEPSAEQRSSSVDDKAKQPIAESRDTSAQPVEKVIEQRASSASDAASRTVSMSRVAAITLAEMPTQPRDGVDIWTSDGSLVAARSLTFNGEVGWGFQLATEWLSKSRSKPTSDNSAADPVAGVLTPNRFIPLSDCSFEYVRDPAESYLYNTSRFVNIARSERFLLGCADISIEGPCAVRFALPKATQVEGTLLTGVVRIVEPAPSDAKVQISLGFENGARETITLDASKRMQMFVVRADVNSSPVVVVQLGDGGNGIIGDRVLLERTAVITR